jgi:hypothetical protein
MHSLFRMLNSAFLIMVISASSQAQSPGGVAHVDSGTVSFDVQERNLMVACVMSELGQWKDLDSVNVKDKASAISYVILRRSLRGTSKGPQTIKETILAFDQFYGVTLKQPHSGRYKGKPEVHAALASLDPGYRKEILTYGNSHHTAFIREILLLLPSDTARSDDAEQFQRDLRAAEAGVDGALSGQAKDVTGKAMFFGGLPDLYRTKDHEPSRIVAVVGKLGSFSDLKALLADGGLHSESHRVELREKKGVDAIFFFK